jgi:2-keto-myo-inositol isomerase
VKRRSLRGGGCIAVRRSRRCVGANAGERYAQKASIIMPFKRALNLMTIRGAPLNKKLEIARAAGYEGVGLWIDETDEAARAGDGLQGVSRALKDCGLAAAELCFVGGWMYPEEGARQRAYAQAEHAFRMAQALNCGCVAACASADSGELEEAASDFGELCDLARQFGVRVALEFIGDAQQVKDVSTAWQIVELAGRSNGGLLIDTFHFYRGGSALVDLEPVTGDKVFLVHINDAPDLPPAEVEDRDRVFPGDGALPLDVIAATLASKGYAGFYSLELFNEDYWAADPYMIAQEGMRSLQRVGI